MYLPFPNPVISAAVLPDNVVLDNFRDARDLHRDIQAGEAEDSEWKPYLVYLMMIGDCMAREIVRRGLIFEPNLILQHPQNQYPDYWKSILVPNFEFWHGDMDQDGSLGWFPDTYPGKEDEPAPGSTDVPAGDEYLEGITRKLEESENVE